MTAARILILVVMAGVFATSLSACGKKGPPHAPGPDNRIIYPGNYPPVD